MRVYPCMMKGEDVKKVLDLTADQGYHNINPRAEGPGL